LARADDAKAARAETAKPVRWSAPAWRS